MAPRPWPEVVAGPHNAAALAAARRLGAAVVRGRLARVLLHGPPGTGKSLLVAALVRRVVRHPKGLTARVSPARELVPAHGDDAPDDWADWVAADLLVVEDLQHLPPRAAGALARLLDARAARRRPTLLTGRDGPGRADWPLRLASRLAAGLVVRVDPPGDAARRAIAERRAEKRGLRITEDAVAALAARPGGVRELLGRVEALRAFPDPGRPLAASDVEAWLGPEAGPDASRWVRRVAEAFGVAESDLLGPSRRRNTARARQVLMYTLRVGAGWSLPRVAAAVGRDHTTVMHAVRAVSAGLERDPALARAVAELVGEAPGRAAA